MNEKLLIEELIETIRKELNQSSSSKYICDDGTIICTDVGYVEDWFCVYADVLRKKYDKFAYANGMYKAPPAVSTNNYSSNFKVNFKEIGW